MADSHTRTIHLTLWLSLALAGPSCVLVEAFSDDEESSAEAGEVLERSLTLIVRSSAQLPIETFELGDVPEDRIVSRGQGFARIEGILGGFSSTISAPLHVEGFVCVDTQVPDSQYTATLIPFAPVQLIEDTTITTTLGFGGVELELLGQSLVDPSAADPTAPVEGPVEVFVTPIPFADLPESVSCPEGIVKEGHEVLDVKLNFMAMADATPMKDGKKLQLNPDKPATLTLPVAPALTKNHDGRPLYVYVLDADGAWERVSSTALEFVEGEQFVRAQIEHFSTYAVAVEVPVIELAAHAIEARDTEARELVVSALGVDPSGAPGPGGLHIARRSSALEPAFPVPPCLFFEVPDLPSSERLDVRSLGDRPRSYRLSGNGAPDEPTIEHSEAPFKPEGAADGEPCVEPSDCESLKCGLGWSQDGLISMCGACALDFDCQWGSCIPGNLRRPGGPFCSLGNIGDPCQSDAACLPEGAVCSSLEINGLEDVTVCGYCDNEDPDSCAMGSSCHPRVYPELLFTGGVWNDCVADGTLAQDHICELDEDGDGHEACENRCSTVSVIEDEFDLGACGECLDAADCGGNECIDPPPVSSLFELLGGLQGSVCAD